MLTGSHKRPTRRLRTDDYSTSLLVTFYPLALRGKLRGEYEEIEASDLQNRVRRPEV